MQIVILSSTLLEIGVILRKTEKSQERGPSSFASNTILIDSLKLVQKQVIMLRKFFLSLQKNYIYNLKNLFKRRMTLLQKNTIPKRILKLETRLQKGREKKAANAVE